jgi:hypothetical protein
MSSCSSGKTKRSSPKTVEVDGCTYARYDDMLLQILADGTPGPVCGRIGKDGTALIEAATLTGEAGLGELLTATMPRRDLPGSVAVPSSVRSAISRGSAAEWRGALDEAAVELCREELALLEAEGVLSRGNHGQVSSIRGDRIAFVCLDGGYCEHMECPALARAFELLESAAVQLEDALGSGPLLTPPFGMVAQYHGRDGYVRHLDNEPYDGGDAAARPTSFRNFRELCVWTRFERTHLRPSRPPLSALRSLSLCLALSLWTTLTAPRGLDSHLSRTAILYLNDPLWCQRDGGELRCFRGGAEADECYLEVLPAGGTVVLFPSRVVPHQVMPSRRPRYAISLWFVSPALLRGSTPEERVALARERDCHEESTPEDAEGDDEREQRERRVELEVVQRRRRRGAGAGAEATGSGVARHARRVRLRSDTFATLG